MSKKPMTPQQVADLVADFLGNMGVDKAIVILPNRQRLSTGFPLVFANEEVGAEEAIFALVGLLGPLVRDDHPVRCLTVQGLLGREEAERCAKCENRGTFEVVDEDGTSPADDAGDKGNFWN
jgi:hypothetical protein